MSEIYYKFSEKFTKCPGGRFRARSDKSGEEFREDVLEKLLNQHARIIMDLDGVIGFPPSFLDEAFGTYVKRLGRKIFEQKFRFVISTNELTRRALEAAIVKNSS